jgi:hypothetical protein
MQAINVTTTKTVRAVAIEIFGAKLAERKEIGNRKFRRDILDYLMQNCGVTNAAATSHYNFAFQQYKNDPVRVHLVEGLGREEHKKGGRPTKDGRATATVYAKLFAQAEARYVTQAVSAEVATEQPVAETQEVAIEQVQLYNVLAVKKNEIVANDLTEADADEYIAANSGKFKPKLAKVAV